MAAKIIGENRIWREGEESGESSGNGDKPKMAKA